MYVNRIDNKPEASLQRVKKFYLLEYFYVLLKSISEYKLYADIFDEFKILKNKYWLGESKYKKLTLDEANSTNRKRARAYYTFEQVVSESIDYGLIFKKDDTVFLTDEGEKLLKKFGEEEDDFYKFNKALFPFMERRFFAFYHIVKFCYEAGKTKNGLLIFPFYSPLRLGFERKNIKITDHLIEYAGVLKKKLVEDIKEFLDREINLTEPNRQLLENLKKSRLLPENKDEKFQEEHYKAILRRFRKFWLDYFLRKIYNYQYSFASFDIWIYRGKQIGIVNTTEFFPDFNGKIIYPTSIITSDKASKNFEKIFTYSTGESLYLHSPSLQKEKNQDDFVDSLAESYFSLRRTSRSYFVNLADISELVCYKMRISKHIFEKFLEEAYLLNLQGELKIKISLEADRLPQETKATYLKREPVMVDGKYRNIIAIDIAKGEEHE